MARRKTAIVLIHGIGEQRPMDTLWGFVKAAWVHDSQMVHASRSETWSKPEMTARSFELRRVTTREASVGDKRRYDFFEFYWAHQMQGHTLGGLLRWTLDLFVRPPSAVPKGLTFAWAVGLGLMLGALAIVLIASATGIASDWGLPRGLVVAAPLLLAGLSLALNAFILPHAGDAARYLSPKPGNVEIRQKIREDGVALIQALSTNGEYDRIVLVGHSLGSVIAHDILNFAWNRLNPRALADSHAEDSAALAALECLEEAAIALVDASPAETGARRAAFRDAQRDYAATLAAGDNPLWIVSDLVTLGSPLSKADILIGRNAGDLKDRIRRREIPSSPPVFEEDRAHRRFSYPLAADVRRPHHAAVFAPVVWTNLYHPHRLIWFGDIVSGPLRALFGKGILDVRLPFGAPAGFRHLDYWRRPEASPPAPAIRALRRALNLRWRWSDTELWGVQASFDEIVADQLEPEI